MIGWGYMTEALIPVSGFPLSELNVYKLCRDAVPTLPSYLRTVFRNESTSVVEGSPGRPRSELILP